MRYISRWIIINSFAFPWIIRRQNVERHSVLRMLEYPISLTQLIFVLLGYWSYNFCSQISSCAIFTSHIPIKRTLSKVATQSLWSVSKTCNHPLINYPERTQVGGMNCQKHYGVTVLPAGNNNPGWLRVGLTKPITIDSQYIAVIYNSTVQTAQHLQS